MNKKHLIFTVLLSFTFLALTAMPFNNEFFKENSIIVAFDSQTVGRSTESIEFYVENNIVVTEISEFNDFAGRHLVNNLKQLHPQVKYENWNKDGVYIQNIYRVSLQNSRNIENTMRELKEEPYILFAEYETINRTREYIPNDPQFAQLYYLPITETPEAWDYVQGSEDIVIAITDTGAKWNHEDLADNIWINEAEYEEGMINWETGQIYGDGVDDDGNGYVDDVLGWDFAGSTGYQEDNNPMQLHPANTHGTHVSGCASAVGDNGIGVVGPGMHVSLMITKGAPDNQETGIMDGYTAIQYAADTGADFINCSWGGPGNGQYPNYIIDYATDAGALVVAAAGNDNTEHIPDVYEDYPSDCTNALCVAATDQNDSKANFSDYGEPIDICAPGVSIRSTYYENENDAYENLQGTSMASPIAAGICGLVKSINPDMEPLEIRTKVMNTADNIDNLNETYAGLLGNGRINAYAACMSDYIPNITAGGVQLVELDGDGDEIANPGELVEMQVYLENGLFWLDATDVVATLECDLEGVTITEDTANYYDLNSGSGMWNFDSEFEFSTLETINTLEIPFTLHLSANPDNEYPYEDEIEFTADLSLDQSGWPYELEGASKSSGLIVDFDNDDQREAIFGHSTGELYAVNLDGSLAEGFPVDLGSDIKTAVAAADISGGEEMEIIAATNNTGLYAVDYEGNTLWQYETSISFWANPIIADIDFDDSKEIIAITMTGELVVLNADGTIYSGYPLNVGSSVISSCAAADLNGDGVMELIASTSNQEVIALSFDSGTNISGFPVSINGTSWKGPIVADITNDDSAEILLSDGNNSLYAIDASGSILFEKTVTGGAKASVVAGDLDDNGEMEIVTVSTAGVLHVVDSEGNDINDFPLDLEESVESTPILADMDNDGLVDIIFGDDAGNLHSINIYGEETANFPLALGSSIKYSAAFADIDGDNDPEILLPNQSDYLLLDYKRTNGSVLWPCFKGTPSRNGNMQSVVAVDDDPEDDPELFTNKLGNNYPNPFNPTTTIQFSLKEQSDVEIGIYNIKGQLVKTILSKDMSAGKHSVNWNGKDSNGYDVSSGLYLYKMKANDFKTIKKMLLLK